VRSAPKRSSQRPSAQLGIELRDPAVDGVLLDEAPG